MKKTGLALTLILALLFSLMVVVQSAQSSSKTIMVPDNYPTIREAINAANEGDTIFVKKGNYEEQTLTINKTISLIGEDQLTTQIKLNPKWIEYVNPIPFDWSKISHFEDSLDITADNVKVSGFTFSSNATSMGGLYLINGNNTLITDNTIQNNSVFLMGSYQIFTQNTVRGSVECYSSMNNVIAGNRVIGDIWVNNAPEFMVAPHTTNVICGNMVTDGNGVAVGGDGNIVFNNQISNSTCGIGTSIYASNCVLGKNQITNNDIGIKAATEGHNNTYFGNQVTANHDGAYVANIWGIGANNVFYDNNFLNNPRDVNTDPVIVGTDHNWTAHQGGSFDNGKRGNYWSRYNGTDANGDGIGDSPFVIDAERRDNYPLMAQFNISSLSINLPEWATAYSSVVFEEPPLEHQASESFPTLSNGIFVFAVVIAIVVISISLLLYKRHRKTAYLKQ